MCLQSFFYSHGVFVNAAFAHGKRKGLLHEKTFNSEYNIADASIKTMAENLHPQMFVDFESKLIKQNLSAFTEIGSAEEKDSKKHVTMKMKELGLER